MIIKDGVLIKVENSDIVNGTFSIPAGVTSIGNTAFRLCTSLKQLNIPNGVTSIGYSAFSECTSLEKINIPNSVTSIGNETFLDCTSLKEITIPNSVTSIGISSFWGCTSLSKITIPNSVTSIGKNAFVDCAISEIKIPEGVTNIEEGTFNGCKSLVSINIPNSVTSIGYGSFGECKSITNLNIPNTITSIDEGAFYGCTKLKRLTLPENLEFIGKEVFENCTGLKEIEYKGQFFTPNQLNDENFSHAFTSFITYAKQNKKFLPKNTNVLTLTNPEEIANFYKHAKDWKEILDTYKKLYKSNFSLSKLLNPNQLNTAIASLYKISIALGLFQDIKGPAGLKQSENEKMCSVAKKFILENIVTIPPERLITLFGGLDTAKNGFVENYASFFMKNYVESKVVDGKKLRFLHARQKLKLFGTKTVNYISAAYNSWNETIETAYPNRTKLLADRESGSNSNNLTEENIIDALITKTYVDTLEGSEELSKLCSIYGYTQFEFEQLQEIWKKSLIIKQEHKLIQAEEDTATDGVKFELMSNQDVTTLFLGEITNCCQVINNVGKPCMEYGATKHNSGFIKFTLNGKIIGQSWIWYNPDTHIVCLDNIEIPKSLQISDRLTESFLNCLKRLSTSITTAMKENGLDVHTVTVGSGYNDLDIIQDLSYISGGTSPTPKDYENQYSDARDIQYIIPGLEKIEEKGSGITI